MSGMACVTDNVGAAFLFSLNTILWDRYLISDIITQNGTHHRRTTVWRLAISPSYKNNRSCVFRYPGMWCPWSVGEHGSVVLGYTVGKQEKRCCDLCWFPVDIIPSALVSTSSWIKRSSKYTFVTCTLNDRNILQPLLQQRKWMLALIWDQKIIVENEGWIHY